MTTNQYIKFARGLAIISFILGTVIFGLYYLTSAFELLFLGYGYIVVAGVINLIFLIKIIVRATNDDENRKKLLITSGLMLVNVPILIIYCWVATILLYTMRITLLNQTGTEISDIKIVGCGGGYIDKLEQNESETVWVTITGDCSLYLEYLSKGERKREMVAGYLTSNMGQKASHKIDGKDKDLF